MRKFVDPQTNYTEKCGCVWVDGKRVRVCPKHRHRDGIKPARPTPYWIGA